MSKVAKINNGQQRSWLELCGQIFLCSFTNYNIFDKFEVITLESFDNNHSNIGEVKSYIKRLV